MTPIKAIGKLTIGILLAAIAFAGSTTFAATTGELLQRGLYAEEVEGNIESAIRTYADVIKNSSAPPNHVAQALYRQGLCYLKLKDEPAARAALQRLVTDYSGQTEIVEKARPVLDDLLDFDPAALMPPGTLVYVECGSPGRQVETVLTILKGTPYENPLAAVAGQKSNNQKSPGDIVGALLNPSMMAEFKKIRSSAIGITAISQNDPSIIAVLYPGKSDALRGLILAGLGMVGIPGDPIEGMQTVNLQAHDGHQSAAVAYDDRVMISATPASELAWSVRQYKSRTSEPNLATSNKSFTKLTKAQRQKNAMTIWANVDEAYTQFLRVIPADDVPGRLRAANAMLDFNNIDELVVSYSVETNGLGYGIDVQFKNGHHCLAYDMVRTPNINRAGLEVVPADAVAVASFSLSQADAVRSEMVRTGLQGLTGLDFGREIFSNIEQITLFAMPVEAGSASSNVFIPGRLGLAITSINPEKTRQVLATMLGKADPSASPQGNGRARYQVGPGDLYCYLDQVDGITLLSLNRGIMDAAIASLRNHKSIVAAGPLSGAVRRIAPTTSKLALVNLGGAIRLFGSQANPGTFNAEQTQRWNANIDQLARATEVSTLELRTDEQPNSLALNTGLSGIPPLNDVLVPVTQIASLTSQAKADSISRQLRQATPATVMPAAKAPVIDGKVDESWSAAHEFKLANTIYSPLTSSNDLTAVYRTLWDENNLYLLVDVTDDVLRHDTAADQWYQSDSVEIFIDADNAKAAEYGENDYQFAVSWDKTKPELRETKHNRTAGVQHALVTTDKGYRVEIKFPWSTLGVKPVAGAKVGLDVAVNDSDGGGQRDSKITWRDERDTAWENPRVFGSAELAGLVGWWKFDETQGTTARDSSGGNHTGTLTGNAKWARGKMGGAVDLDGHGSFVRIADKAAFDIGGEVTVACWVNIRSVPAEWTAIVSKGDDAWRLSTVEQERRFHFAVNDFGRFNTAVLLNGPTEVSANSWHHLAAVYGGGVMTTYVDGRQEATRPWAGGLGRNDFDVLIGENDQLRDRCFDGLIDDVRIYNYAASESRIKALAAGQ